MFLFISWSDSIHISNLLHIALFPLKSIFILRYILKAFKSLYPSQMVFWKLLAEIYQQIKYFLLHTKLVAMLNNAHFTLEKFMTQKSEVLFKVLFCICCRIAYTNKKYSLHKCFRKRYFLCFLCFQVNTDCRKSFVLWENNSFFYLNN